MQNKERLVYSKIIYFKSTYRKHKKMLKTWRMLAAAVNGIGAAAQMALGEGTSFRTRSGSGA